MFCFLLVDSSSLIFAVPKSEVKVRERERILISFLLGLSAVTCVVDKDLK